MDELVKRLIKIKRKEKLSYEHIARELNVSFNSVWRWCNGKFEPLPIIKDKIREFIKRHSRK